MDRIKIEVPLRMVGTYDPNDLTIYEYLERNGMVKQTYEKHFGKRQEPGGFFLYKKGKEKIVLVSTNMWMTYSKATINKSGRSKRGTVRYHILFDLTKEGWDYLKCKTVESKI